MDNQTNGVLKEEQSRILVFLDKNEYPKSLDCLTQYHDCRPLKIREIQVRNYKSIKKQKLDGLGDLVILIGANSSGKTTLLEALELLFSQFSAVGGKTDGLTDLLWHKRRPNSGPIEFVLQVEITPEEFRSLGLPDPPEKPPDTLEIHRKLLDVTGQWTTQKIKLGETTLVDDDKFIVTSTEQIPATTQYADKVTALIKDRFRLIQAVRGVQSVGHLRTPQIPQATLDSVKTLGLSENSDDMASFGKFKQNLPNSFPGNLGVRQDYLYVERQSIRFPIEYIGGGHQDRFALQAQFETGDVIFGLEEPEIHQHPDSARDLFDFLKAESKQKQIFITTHSPIFVDRENIDSTWLSRLDGLETKFSKPKEWKEILETVGANPSDNFVPDLVLLVEGESDKAYIKGLADSEKLRVDNIRICPIHGKSKSRYNLDAWRAVAEGSQIRLILFLDRSAEEEITEMVKRGLLGSDDYILLSSDLEDSYPQNLLKETIQDLFKTEVTEQDLSVPPRVPIIEKILKQNNKYQNDWKTKVAVTIASKVSKNDLPNEFRKLLELIVEYSKR